MNQAKIIHGQMKLVIVSLFLLVSACNAQEQTDNSKIEYIYDGKEIIEFEKTEDNKGPVVYQIYRDQNDRLWFLGFGGAYRLENGKFLNITKNGPW